MGPHGLLGSGPPKTPGSILCRQQEQEEEEAESSGLLQVLARQGHCDTIRHLLSQGTEALDRQDDHGRTPLFWATEYRHESLVELMLTHGADTAARDNEGNLCLHWAAYVGSAPIVKLLLEAGSDLNAPNNQGDRPLHLAAQEGRYECLVLLLAHGAKVFLKNEAGQLPLQCARPQSPCWKALQAACAHPPYQPERILSRDISRGFERLPIPCLNGLDQEPCPSNFLYVTRNIKSDAVASASASWGHDQPCQCPVTCSAGDCPCVLRSQRFWYTTDGRLVPEAANPSAKMGTIHECGMLCSCPSNCSNRVVQKGLRTQLQLYRMPAKGWGVRTMQDLPLGFFVCQYFGELISSAEAAQREEDAYYFVVDAQAGKECCLDGRFYGNIGRFLNHSCQPNLTAVQVTIGLEGPGIAFFTTREVQAGEELGFDYGDRFWEVKGRRRWACQCASPRCRYASPSSPTAAAGEPVGSGPLRGFALKSKRRIPLPRKAPRPGRPRDASRP